jgi:hypothetical protein
MSILSIDLHSSKSTIRLSFHFQNVTYESLDGIYCSKFNTGCNPHVLGWRPQPCVSSLQFDVGYPVVIAAVFPDAMLLPIDGCFAQEVPEPVYEGLTCPKYVIWDSKPGSWLTKEQKSWLRFGGRRLLLLNDETRRCHPYTQALQLVGGCRNGGQQLVARRLWCIDHPLGWLNPARSHERYTPNHYGASTVRDSWLDVPWSIGCIFVSRNPHPAVCCMKQKSALVWPMDLAPRLSIPTTSC